MLIKFLLSPVAQWLRHPTVEPLVIVGSNLGIGKKLFLPSNWHNRHTVQSTNTGFYHWPIRYWDFCDLPIRLIGRFRLIGRLIGLIGKSVVH